MAVALDAGSGAAAGTGRASGARGFDQPATLVLDAVPSAVAGTRRWLCSRVAAAGADDDAVRLAELLGSEVVTNAVRHGDPGGVVTVTVARTGKAVRVTVTDAGSGHPVVCRPRPEDAGGRGLQLVDGLAAAWGIERHPVGKSVWFELDLAGTATA